MALCSQFSYGATDLELTTKRDRYPLFFRTVPTDFVFNEPRLRFIQRFGWKDEIGLIYDASPYYSRVSQNFTGRVILQPGATKCAVELKVNPGLPIFFSNLLISKLIEFQQKKS